MRDEIPIQSCVLVILASFFFLCGMRFVDFSGSGFEDNFYIMCIALFVYLEPFVYIHEGLLTDGMRLKLTVFAW